MKKLLQKIGLTKSIRKNLCQIAWWQWLTCKHGDKLFSLIPLKGTKLDFHRSTQIVGNGVLWLNKKWSKADSLGSLMVMAKDSKLVLNGHFDVFTGAKIYVNGGGY